MRSGPTCGRISSGGTYGNPDGLIFSPKTGPFEAGVFPTKIPGLGGGKTMKASKFSDAQKRFILKQGADGVPR